MLIYKFKEQLQEGMVFTISSFNVASNSGSYRPSRNEYKLNFTINTKVKLSKTVLVPTNVYSFTPAPDVFNESYDNNCLVDVIGVMIGVGVEREYERDGYVEEMNSFLSSGESQNAVVAIMLTKVKLFQGKPALQNAFSSIRITFNPEIGETKELRKRYIYIFFNITFFSSVIILLIDTFNYSFLSANTNSPASGLIQLPNSSRIPVNEEFLLLTPRTTIEELKNVNKFLFLFITTGSILVKFVHLLV
ncbi:putative nucleic acid-binding protein [Medicago truncatula]|uniref:Putative nucleic acid-binding protein n=1 Tax=Medicago truncatula TaxID=3880 RepID=A0A396JUL2_MEDTR|nr:putative nucleic acid-binding protein [Medicago truncatula]